MSAKSLNSKFTHMYKRFNVPHNMLQVV